MPTHESYETEEGATSQGIQIDPRSWENQRLNSPLEPPERKQLGWTLDFIPGRPMLDFRIAELQDNKLGLF